MFLAGGKRAYKCPSRLTPGRFSWQCALPQWPQCCADFGCGFRLIQPRLRLLHGTYAPAHLAAPNVLPRCHGSAKASSGFNKRKALRKVCAFVTPCLKGQERL
ncbi:MAG: hypothetical protein CR217_08585 [Beijerinckiaceae bacterium]|nr:MAG: hypothetical protein CR217_08585 [Beijerinckiaceae bacterium]